MTCQKVVQNLITELPSHIENKKAQQEFEKLSEVTTGDKNQLKDRTQDYMQQNWQNSWAHSI